MELFKLFSKKEQSKNIAKERLKLVLVHDRADLSPRLLDMIREDIIGIISKYADIAEEDMDIKFTRMKKNTNEESTSALVVNIPINKIKDDIKN